MTKVYVSSLNIYNPIKYNIENAAANARSAEKIPYPAPSGFAYSSYLSGLNDKFAGIRAQLEAVEKRLEMIERNYSNLVSDSINDLNLIDNSKVNVTSKIVF